MTTGLAPAVITISAVWGKVHIPAPDVAEQSIVASNMNRPATRGWMKATPEMTVYPEQLRLHATALEAAADFFVKDFLGTEADEHAEKLREAARQFREDAAEYEATE